MRLEILRRPPWWQRLVAWVAARKLGKVPSTLGIYGHNSRIMMAMLAYEQASAGATALDGRLASLVQLRVAMRIGCPF